jgi:predicted nucleotide-binding protein
MDKQEIIDELEKFKQRLFDNVAQAFEERGSEYGNQRFIAWQRALNAFFKINLPRSIKDYNALFSIYDTSRPNYGEPAVDYFVRTKGHKIFSFLDSLILDVQNDEFNPIPINKEVKQVETTLKVKSNKVLIVHGHEDAPKFRTEAFLRKHGFDPIILHLNASKGDTIIQKLERLAKDVSFGIVLYTPDDMGESKSKAAQHELLPRARQNVIFEHGYLMGLIGRPNVAAIVEGNVEKPGDIDGVVYISSSNWEIELLRELREAEYTIDAKNL